MKRLSWDAIITAPGFSLGVVCAGDQIDTLCFLKAQQEISASTPLAIETVRQLKAWLVDPQFIFDLPQKRVGTPFQQRVWEQIAAIPCGRVRTYGELARTLQSAPRAVGQACGANPLPLIVPCHRVIASGGGLGGFSRQGGGFLCDIKRWLLAREREA